MVSWMLVGGGILLVLIEVMLGAALGFDFVLIGTALVLGGILGLVTGSTPIGAATAGVLALLYVALGRRWVRGRLAGHGTRSNVDALIGAPGVITEAVSPEQPGRVRVRGDLWLADGDGRTLAIGASVTVQRVEGITLHVAAQ